MVFLGEVYDGFSKVSGFEPLADNFLDVTRAFFIPDRRRRCAEIPVALFLGVERPCKIPSLGYWSVERGVLKITSATKKQNAVERRTAERPRVLVYLTFKSS